MTPKHKKRVALIAGISFLVLLGAGVFVNNQFCSPQRSILILTSAMNRRDRDTVKEYVDAPELAESIRQNSIEEISRQWAQTNTNSTDRVLNPLADAFVRGIVNATITPDSVISMLCGENVGDAMKEGIGNSSDETVDALTQNGTPKTKIYGVVGKVLIRWAAGLAIDEATRENEAKQEGINLNDYTVSAQYETLNRYIIIITPHNSDDPAIVKVFKRHGLATWKFSEVRILPQTPASP